MRKYATAFVICLENLSNINTKHMNFVSTTISQCPFLGIFLMLVVCVAKHAVVHIVSSLWEDITVGITQLSLLQNCVCNTFLENMQVLLWSKLQLIT